MPEIDAPVRAKGVVHWRIAKVAKQCAQAYWEQSASKSNIFYANAPPCEIFVAANWQEFIPIARGMLTDLLGMDFHPGTITRITPEEKQTVYDALKLDGAINPRKVSTKNKLITSGASLLPLSPGRNQSVH